MTALVVWHGPEVVAIGAAFLAGLWVGAKLGRGPRNP